MPQKLDGGFRGLVRVNGRIGCPGSVIHTDMEIFPAGAATRDLPRSRLSVPHAINLAQTFDVQMKHLSGLFPLIPPHRRLFLQRGEARAIKIAQYPKHSTARKAEICRYVIAGQPLFAQGKNLSVYRFRQLASTVNRAGTPVSQSLYASLLITFFPFSGSSYAHAETSRDNRGWAMLQPPDHFLSTFGRQFGIFVAVHPAPRPVIGLCSNFQLTELGQGEQPIETLQLVHRNFRAFLE